MSNVFNEMGITDAFQGIMYRHGHDKECAALVDGKYVGDPISNSTNWFECTCEQPQKEIYEHNLKIMKSMQLKDRLRMSIITGKCNTLWKSKRHIHICDRNKSHKGYCQCHCGAWDAELKGNRAEAPDA